MTNPFFKPMSEKSDAALLIVLTTERKDYVPKAIEAAEHEFRKRFPDQPLPNKAPEEEVEVVTSLDRTVETEIKERPKLEKGHHYENGVIYTLAETLPKEDMLNYTGRISVGTYWTRWLICFGINIVAIILKATDDDIAIFSGFIAQLSVTVFIIMQGAKRMHDIDKNGWHQFIPLYNIILLFTDGTIGPNQYGDDPKGRIPA